MDISDDFKNTVFCTPFENFVVGLKSFKTQENKIVSEYFQNSIFWIEGKQVLHIHPVNTTKDEAEYYFVCADWSNDNSLFVYNSQC